MQSLNLLRKTAKSRGAVGARRFLQTPSKKNRRHSQGNGNKRFHKTHYPRPLIYCQYYKAHARKRRASLYLTSFILLRNARLFKPVSCKTSYIPTRVIAAGNTN